jgi:hypothetical protein
MQQMALPVHLDGRLASAKPQEHASAGHDAKILSWFHPPVRTGKIED